MDLPDNKNSRLHVSLAKYFFWIMLVLFFATNLIAAYLLLINSINLAGILMIELLFFIIFITGELFLILGIFWWKIKFKN